MDLDQLMEARKRELRLLLDASRIPADAVVERAPRSQGCYAIWKRGLARPLYIGKAANLRNRLQQHFVAAYDTQFREWLAKDTRVKEVRFRTNSRSDKERLRAWIRDWCEIQFVAFRGDVNRFERLAIGTLDPVLQSDSDNENPDRFDEVQPS